MKLDKQGRVVRRTSLPKSVDDKLIDKANKEKRTISNLMRVAIEHYLDNKK